ncbi:hypothetical protein BV898_12499 [Hypsibius exemplaris]|uniref:Uncharacterized protein n=1 Tax=Hypsibius exemplaris TaxID=2072580 RepID=A0A1W0WDT1_HYPEX|nr:hypothetical protein BV898_12499 [Hypsibius exemplaris]
MSTGKLLRSGVDGMDHPLVDEMPGECYKSLKRILHSLLAFSISMLLLRRDWQCGIDSGVQRRAQCCSCNIFENSCHCSAAFFA